MLSFFHFPNILWKIGYVFLSMMYGKMNFFSVFDQQSIDFWIQRVIFHFDWVETICFFCKNARVRGCELCSPWRLCQDIVAPTVVDCACWSFILWWNNPVLVMCLTPSRVSPFRALARPSAGSLPACNYNAWSNMDIFVGSLNRRNSRRMFTLWYILT